MTMLDVWCRHRVWRDGEFVWRPPRNGRICEECLPRGYRCVQCDSRENLVPLPEDPTVLFCRACLERSPIPHMPESDPPRRR